MKPDFSGYATKNDQKCSDGRTIRHGAFSKNDGGRVPLVWQHRRDVPGNVLGYAELEQTADGMYARAYFNDTDNAQNTKRVIQHGDINQMSIYANQVQMRGDDVVHGNIVEVSLVLLGANPKAVIDFVDFSHGDDLYYEDEEREAVIMSGLAFEHAGSEDAEDDEDDEDDTPSPAEVFDSMTEIQQRLLIAVVEEALEQSGDESEDAPETNNDKLSHSDLGEHMKENIFDKSETKSGADIQHDFQAMQAQAIKEKRTLNEVLLEHAVTYGIENIDLMFPDAKALPGEPQFKKRDTGWVGEFLSATTHSPFARIKTLWADITHEEARARGYIKGSLKKEEFFALTKRETTPATIYKKQRLDNDDIIDITDYDVVRFLKSEMRLMLDEELSIAALLGDGRAFDSPDKISETKVRPIVTDSEPYNTRIALPTNFEEKPMIALGRARLKWHGTGRPNLYVSPEIAFQLLTLETADGVPLFRTMEEVAARLQVAKIVEVELLSPSKNLTIGKAADDTRPVAVFVNPADYTFGSTNGGGIRSYETFDLDYNQHKYLMETRTCGALTRLASAVTVFATEADIASLRAWLELPAEA